MKACITGDESAAATTRSMSPTVERMRRRLPAASAFSTPGIPQEGEHTLGERPGLAERDAVGAAGKRFDPEEQAGFGFLTHAGEAPQLSGAGGGFQLGQRGDVELLPEQGDLLGTQVGHLEQVDQGGRNFSFEPLEEVKPTGGEELVDLLGDRFADAGDLGEAAFFPVFDRFSAEVGQAVGGLAVGEDLVDDFALDLEQVGDLREDLGELEVGVVFVWCGHRQSNFTRERGGIQLMGVAYFERRNGVFRSAGRV